jgi:hypothetical protein
VLVDLPELFLFSAPYLMTAFTDARVTFWSDEQPLGPSQVAEHDFVFVPNTSFAALEVSRLDLAVNMVSFQEMTSDQVWAYTERLFALGCPAVYSLNRDRSSYNPELTSVRKIIGARYQLEEVQVLPVPYTKLVTRAKIDERRGERPSASDYRHVVGRLDPAEPAREAPVSAERPSGRWHRVVAALRRP